MATKSFVERLQNGLVKVLSDERDLSVQLFENLQAVIASKTVSGLGDRTTYVGGSDLDKCVRSVVKGKRFKPAPDLKRALYFMRGHLSELIVMMALRAENIPFTYQPEVTHPEKPYSKVHIDFVSETKNRVHVLEVKSGTLRSDIDFWRRQLYSQMGHVKLMRPNKEVTGSILNIDLTAAELRYFNSHKHDPEVFVECMERTELVWHALNSGTEDEYAKREILCAWCDHQEGCPAFAGKGYFEFPVLEEEHMAWELAKCEKSSAEKTYKSLDKGFKDTLIGIGRYIAIGDWIVGVQKRANARYIDWEKLKAEDRETHDRIKANFMKPQTFKHVIDSFERQEKDVSADTQEQEAA